MASIVLKITVVVVNILLLGLGIILAALGIWVLGVDYGLVKLSKIQDNGFYSMTLLEPGLLETAAVICIVVGGVMVVTSALTLHGVRKESKCIMAICAALFVALIFMDVIVIILTALTHRRVEDSLHQSLLQGVQTQYDDLISSQFVFSVHFDRAQVQFECCGVDSYKDFANSTSWIAKREFQIPQTCCALISKSSYLDDHTYQPKDTSCQTSLNTYNKQPCYNKIKDWLTEKSFVLLGFSAFTAFIKFIGSALNILFLRRLKQDSPYNDL